MLKPIIYPYKMSSQSARLLSLALNTRRVFPNRNYHPRQNHLVVNWGNSHWPEWGAAARKLLNPPCNVAIATNKLETFRRLRDCDVSTPDYKVYKEDAEFWVSQGKKVVCRQTLTGHSGQGIVIASTIDELVDAPLYTQFIKKDKEYRVHVFQGKIIDYQQKKKKEGYTGGVSGIRNHANGWIYARSGVELPEEVSTESSKAVKALGLDFGAVDICTCTSGKVYIFEVNTAPGLQGSTLTNYVEAIQELL